MCRGCGATGGGRSGSPFPPCASPRVLHGQGRQRQPKRARGHGEEAGTTKADQPVSATKCAPALLTSPGNGSLAVYAGPPIHLRRRTARKRREKMEPVKHQQLTVDRLPKPPEKKKPLPHNDLRPIHPRRAPFFHRGPETRAKTQTLAPKHLTPVLPTSSPGKAYLQKIPRLFAAPPTSEHTIGVNTPPPTEPTPAANTGVLSASVHESFWSVWYRWLLAQNPVEDSQWVLEEHATSLSG